jgi:hypothetical protein
VSTQQRNGKPSRFALITGGASFVLSWGIIAVQLFGDPSRVNWMFLVVALVMSGVPSGVAAGNLILNRGAGTPPTTSPPSPVSLSPPPPSPSSSPGGNP